MATTISYQKNLARIEQEYANYRELIRKEIVECEEPGAKIDISNAIARSGSFLEGYATLDWQHRSDIQALTTRIRNYEQDSTRKRPLNVIMQARPGSGKSHFIKCLARGSRLSGVASAVTFNMSGMQRIDDLMQPLDGIRNLKVIDRLPILFLDEFDSSDSNYALLLPLLWDGELHVGHRNLKTGKAVIILAASGDRIQKAMVNAKGMQKAPVVEPPKLIDLLSRINGGEFAIPDLDEVTATRDRRTDKVCIAVALLQDRYEGELQTVPWSLLKFISVTRFRYGVRSITHLLELLPAPAPAGKGNDIKLEKLPL